MKILDSTLHTIASQEVRDSVIEDMETQATELNLEELIEKHESRRPRVSGDVQKNIEVDKF